jgi:UDP-N-acetylglucosamine acyltransferase
MYEIIYNAGSNFSDALEKIELGFPESEERDTIISFIRNSKRGIIRGMNSETKGNID